MPLPPFPPDLHFPPPSTAFLFPPPWCRAVRCAVPLRLACARARAEPSRGTSRGGHVPGASRPDRLLCRTLARMPAPGDGGYTKRQRIGKHAAQHLPRTPGNRRFNAFWLDPEGGCSPYGLTRDAFNPLTARRVLLRCEVAACVGIEEVTKGGKFSTKNSATRSYAVERLRCSLSPS